MLRIWTLPILFEVDPFDWRTIGVVIAVLAVISFAAESSRVRKEARRYRALAALAREHGLQFCGDQARPAPPLPRFQLGTRQAPVNTLMTTRSGQEIQLGDFNYQHSRTDRDGNRHVTHFFFSYCWLRASGSVAGELLIRPERTLDKLQAAAGWEDINFESHDFSRRFFVKSPNRRFAYDVITPRMMEFLLAHPDYTIELNPAGLVLTIGVESRWNLERFPAAIDFAQGFWDRLPAHLLSPSAEPPRG